MSAPATKAFSPAPVSTTTRTLVVCAGLVMTWLELGERRGVQRVQDFRPVDRDDEHGAVALDEQVFVGHIRAIILRGFRRPGDATRATRAPSRDASGGAREIGEPVGDRRVAARHERLMELVGDTVGRGGRSHAPAARPSASRRPTAPRAKPRTSSDAEHAVADEVTGVVGEAAGQRRQLWAGSRATKIAAICSSAGPQFQSHGTPTLSQRRDT